DLTRRLGNKLQVIVAAECPSAPPSERDVLQQDRISAHVQAQTGLTCSDFIIVFRPYGLDRVAYRRNELVVDANLAGSRRDVSVLLPFSESAINARGDGPIVLPFGDGESALWASRLG